METKWIWVVAIVCLVVFLTAISRHRKIPGLEDCFQCPKWGEKSFLKCPACNKNVWALLKKNHSFAEQKEESIP